MAYLLAVLAIIVTLLASVACAAPAPSATEAPTPTNVPITPPPTCPPGVSRPADVTMLNADEDEVIGLLGSFNFCDGESQAPWPTAADLPAVQLTADEINMLVSIAEGQSFLRWQAAYSPTSATGPANSLTLSEGTSESGVDTVSFGGPPTGEWVVSVTLGYPGEIGSATYFWRVIAPEPEP